MKMTREQAILEYLYQKSLNWEERDKEKIRKLKKELINEQEKENNKQNVRQENF